jgi:hypothetical protein
MGSEGRSTAYATSLVDLGEFDADARYAVFVCRQAGFPAEVSSAKRVWRIGDVELTVSLWLDEEVRYVVFVHAGWSGRPAPRSLILAQVYAVAVHGELRVAKGPELARWRNRALIDAGLVARPTVSMPELADSAPPSAKKTWSLIEQLLAARNLTDSPAEPVPLNAPFLERWSGGTITASEIVSARQWYEANGYIVHVDDAPGIFGKPLKLWQLRDPTKPRLVRLEQTAYPSAPGTPDGLAHPPETTP